MKFKSITIENLFSYYGQRHFEFAHKEKPIILIIGENGFGKTSFINAVKIALHGISKDILNIGSQHLSKEDFIVGNRKKNFSGLLNRKAKLEGKTEAKISIKIDVDEILIIQRTFTLSNSSYIESLMLYDEEQNLLAQGDDAQDIINQKISPTMAGFFFFDGEKIQTIADFSHAEFTKMLEDVLELDIYDQMANDAETLIRKINKVELNQNLQQEVNQKEESLHKLIDKIESLEEKLLNEKNIILKEMETDKRDLDNKLKKLKSRFQNSLANARESLAALEHERLNLVSMMKKATLVQLPLLLNPTLFKRINKDINQNYRGKIQIDSTLLATKKQQLLQLLRTQTDTEVIANAFDSVFQSNSDNQSVSFADPYTLEQRFDALPTIDLSVLLNNLSENAQTIKEKENEIINLESQIAQDQQEYKSDFTLAAQMTEDIIRQKVKCETLEQEIKNLQKEYQESKRELGRLTIQEHKNNLANTKIETLQSIIKVSSIIKKKIKTDKRINLEKSINLKFQQLKKEGYEADKIILDENFHIYLYDMNGHAMDILSSSSGQKQIIATALIWGISEYIAEDIPSNSGL